MGEDRQLGVEGAPVGGAGFAGDEPHVPAPVKLAMIEDKAALRDQLLRWAERDGLKRILVSHGEAITDDPGGALRDLAAALE